MTVSDKFTLLAISLLHSTREVYPDMLCPEWIHSKCLWERSIHIFISFQLCRKVNFQIISHSLPCIHNFWHTWYFFSWEFMAYLVIIYITLMILIPLLLVYNNSDWSEATCVRHLWSIFECLWQVTTDLCPLHLFPPLLNFARDLWS